MDEPKTFLHKRIADAVERVTERLRREEQAATEENKPCTYCPEAAKACDPCPSKTPTPGDKIEVGDTVTVQGSPFTGEEAEVAFIEVEDLDGDMQPYRVKFKADGKEFWYRGSEIKLVKRG